MCMILARLGLIFVKLGLMFVKPGLVYVKPGLVPVKNVARAQAKGPEPNSFKA